MINMVYRSLLPKVVVIETHIVGSLTGTGDVDNNGVRELDHVAMPSEDLSSYSTLEKRAYSNRNMKVSLDLGPRKAQSFQLTSLDRPTILRKLDENLRKLREHEKVQGTMPKEDSDKILQEISNTMHREGGLAAQASTLGLNMRRYRPLLDLLSTHPPPV
jgi:hypothetical protein